MVKASKNRKIINGATVEEKCTTLSLTVNDKQALKMIAAERETTIAAIIREWIIEYIKEVDD